MAFRNKETGEYPVLHEQIRQLNPNSSFPAWFTEAEGFDWVEPAEPPAHDPLTQYREEGEPAASGGTWTQTWMIRDFDPEIVSMRQASQTSDRAAQIRSQRTRLLEECDWTQLPDAPVNQQAWANYRQALRDISSQPGFPWEIEWPSKP